MKEKDPREPSNAGIEDTEDDEAPEEQAIDQRPVPFLDDELAAAMTTGGSIFITLPGMCAALGLSLKAQMRRIKRTRALTSGLRRIPLKTSGGVQRVNCVRLDKIALWLAGVQTSQVNPTFREKIEAYQDELAPVATEVFMRVMGLPTNMLVPSSAPSEAHVIAEQIDTLTGVVSLLREHLAGLLVLPGKVDTLSEQLQQAISFLQALAGRQDAQGEQIAQIDVRTQRLTPAHTRDVKEFIDHMVRDTKSLAAPLTYIAIYGRLKHRFRVATYKEIADDLFADVLAFLQEELRRALGGEAPAQGMLF
ncbi:MAG TPA: phage antirepressor N-terminal domain-containing protein [Ktedonobacterales bacterium]|nr:phage antirepressor N-terminal domain-containing protein [Ktedonobacterales bacterium]